MQVNAAKLASLADDLKYDIDRGYCRSAAPIGKIDGVTFELVAYSEGEAEDQGVEPPDQEHECLTPNVE